MCRWRWGKSLVRNCDVQYNQQQFANSTAAASNVGYDLLLCAWSSLLSFVKVMCLGICTTIVHVYTWHTHTHTHLKRRQSQPQEIIAYNSNNNSKYRVWLPSFAKHVRKCVEDSISACAYAVQKHYICDFIIYWEELCLYLCNE